MHITSRQPNFLLVSLEGEVTYQDIQKALDEEMVRDDYRDMNDIWQLDRCTLLVEYGQFEKIVNDIKSRYPEQASRTKTALVASSGVSRMLMEFWTEVAETLPYEIQIFMTMDEAEAWIA